LKLYVLGPVWLFGLCLPQVQSQTALWQGFPPRYHTPPAAIVTNAEGSTYVPMDSWIYAALDRLHSLGYLDSAFLGIRPWTRLSIAHMLGDSADRIDTETNNDEARDIYLAVLGEVQPDINGATEITRPSGTLESVYIHVRGVTAAPLRDSFHLGQSIIDDYGRPYQSGFNSYSGFSARAEAGRLSVYFRGEYQHAPSASGYSATLATYLSENIESIPIDTNPHQDTVPQGPITEADKARILEANLSYHLLGHEVSFGKSDHWLGPDQGAAMLWSDNAEDIYHFQVDRVEPLRIPLLSRLTGPFRYVLFVGSLKGHTDPNDPWVHVEKVSFKPTSNLEFGFDRMVIWGGKDHEPITLHTFLKSFFSFKNVPGSEKFSANDPGARFGTFDVNYRLPLMRKWITFYTDSFVHDDVSPIDAPRRAAFHPGIYLARLPNIEHLDLRVEAASTDPGPAGSRDVKGTFFFYEAVQKQGPTNKGFLVGDWIGRQGKGGQAWLTYHLSPKEDIQFMYRNAKASNSFIPGGTTQNDFQGEVRKRIAHDLEVRARVQHEVWRAPIYMAGRQSDTTVDTEFIWCPRPKSQ
jgi:hypothetical protein